MRRRVCSSIFALCTLGCGGPADIPSTPDLTELTEAYERPTALLDAPAVQAALATMPPLAELAAGFRAGRFPADDLDTASEPARHAGSLRIQGSIRVTFRCPGALSEPSFDPALNGSVSLTLAIAENRIRRTFGGTAERCIVHHEILGERVRIEIDGIVAFDVGRDLGLGEGFSGNLLANFERLNVAGRDFQDVSARFTEGRLEHLFTFDGGTFVASLSDSGVTIRDGRGIWLCLETQTCAEQ